MLLLRKYQLDIIFLYFALMLIVGVCFYLLEFWGADPHEYEWLITAPLLIFYFVVLGKIRDEIQISDRRNMTAKSLLYWIVLGIILVASYSSPISATEFWSINALFIAFTLFLADSFWDFKKLTLKCFWDKQETK